MLGQDKSIILSEIKLIITMIIWGIIHTAFAFLLYTSSVQILQAQTIAVLSYIDPVVAVILSATLLRERLGWLQILGGILILGSAYISENKRKLEDGNILEKPL